MYYELYSSGGCINSSPAGKRRIAVGAEQQLSQFGGGGVDEGNFGGVGLNGADSTGVLAHVGSPFTTITAIAIAGCLLIVTVFVIIFAILQVSTIVSRIHIFRFIHIVK